MRGRGIQQEVEEVAKLKEAAKMAMPNSILEAFENIVELADNSKLSDEFFKDASNSISYAVKKLNLTEMQVALLALFIDKI